MVDNTFCVAELQPKSRIYIKQQETVLEKDLQIYLVLPLIHHSLDVLFHMSCLFLLQAYVSGDMYLSSLQKLIQYFPEWLTFVFLEQIMLILLYYFLSQTHCLKIVKFPILWWLSRKLRASLSPEQDRKMHILVS